MNKVIAVVDWAGIAICCMCCVVFFLYNAPLMTYVFPIIGFLGHGSSRIIRHLLKKREL